MASNSTDVIVGKRLKRHKTEVILLCLIIILAIIPIPAGIGIFFHVDNLNITR